MPAFLARYPAVLPDWHLDNRQDDLIGEGFDAAIGGDIELSPGVVARRLAPAHLVPVAAPVYLQGRPLPRHPRELAELDGLVMRSPQSGKLRQWMLRHLDGEEAPLLLPPRLLLDDPDALRHCALVGMVVALLAMADVAEHLKRGNGALLSSPALRRTKKSPSRGRAEERRTIPWRRLPQRPVQQAIRRCSAGS